MKIQCLIVDENPNFHEIIKKTIEAYHNDFQVLTAADVEQAIQAINLIDFSLILIEPKFAHKEAGLITSIMREERPIPLIITGQDATLKFDNQQTWDCIKSMIARPFRAVDLAGKIVLALGNIYHRGNLHGVGCASFFQVLEQNYSDCLLRITNSKGDSEGLIFYKDGRPIDAVCGTLEAVDALKQLLSWEIVDIELFDICPLNKNRINKEITSLILQNEDKSKEVVPPAAITTENNISSHPKKPIGGLAGLYLKKKKT